MSGFAYFGWVAVLAALVGYAFEWLHVLHGLLLGSLLATVVCGVVWQKPILPKWVLPLIQVVLGISTGLLFKAWSRELTATQGLSFVLMLVSLLVYMSLAFVWLRRVAHWSRTDALLAVYPGALAAVLDVFHVARASNHVVLVHILRLFVLTLLVTLLIPADVTAPTQAHGWEFWRIAAGDVLPLSVLLVSIVLLGWLLRRLHVPAPYLLTAMVSTAVVVHAGWLSTFVMPRGVTDVSTILLGVLIGSILADLHWTDVLRHGCVGAMVMLMAIAVTALFAGLAAWLLHLDFLTLMVSYIPGAIETVATVTLAAGMNVMFILSHHLLRLMILHALPAFVRAPPSSSEL